MKNLLTTYNGVEGKAHGFYKFDVLDFKSSGDREDGAEGVAGISASNARAAAANNDMDSKNQQVLDNTLKHCSKLLEKEWE
jgi:hypothetical protein